MSVSLRRFDAKDIMRAGIHLECREADAAAERD
jgi:hypothetical protein